VITVLQPGMLASIQDQGRPGLRHLGVGRSGALDGLSLSIGNALVGNPPGAAGLELTLPPAQFRFESACLVALTGAHCPAQLDGSSVGAGRAIAVGAGQTLRLGEARAGARAYLCVAGGIDVAPVLGSRSTDLQAHIGGLEGRALRKGDRLAVGPAGQPIARESPRAHGDAAGAPPAVVRLPDPGGAIRVLPGPEFDEFADLAREAFLRSVWTVAPQSNRMGFRLQGPALGRTNSRDLNSHAVFPGLVQVPPGGAPILLMADAQATGGYPRIASVIAADLWRVAQVRPGGAVSFELASREQAQGASQRQYRYLSRMQDGLDAHRSQRRSG